MIEYDALSFLNSYIKNVNTFTSNKLNFSH